MPKIICQVLVDRPKRLIIIGLFLLLLGFSCFSGGPIQEALAQSESACQQKVEILPEANKPANDSLTKVNVDALNIKLTCKEIVNVWKTLLGATDIVVALYLIAIAVVTIFHIQYDTYSIKKTLPPLIVGVILANFSLFITRVMVDFASVMAVTFINAEGGQSQFLKKLIEGIYGNFGATIGAYVNSSAGDNPEEAFKVMFVLFKFLGGATGLVLLVPLFFIGLVFTIVPAIFIFTLALLFYARYYIVIALAVVSPLAFIGLAFPPTQKYFQRWWQEAIKWIFMLPVSMFLLWLAIQMAKLVAGDNTSIGSYLVSLIFLYLAIKVPFGMGNIMGVDIGGKLGGMAKLATTGVVVGAVAAGWRGIGSGVARYRRLAGARGLQAATLRGQASELTRQRTALKEPGQRLRRLAYQRRREAAHAYETGNAVEGNRLMGEYQQILAQGQAESRRIGPQRIRIRAEEQLRRMQAREAQTQQRRYERYANTFSYMNIPGIIEAVKTRISAEKESAQKEMRKQPIFRNLAGGAFQYEAGLIAYRDAIRQYDELQTAQFLHENLLSRLRPELYDSPQNFRRLMQTFASESPARMLDYLNANLRQGAREIGMFQFAGASTAVDRANQFMSAGQMPVRQNFSESITRAIESAGEPAIAQRYRQAGGTAATGVIRAAEQDRATAQTIVNAIRQQTLPVNPVDFSDQLASLNIGRMTVSQLINPQALSAARNQIVRPSEDQLRAIATAVGRTPEQINTMGNRVQRVVIERGINARVENILSSPDGALFQELGENGRRSLQEYLNATKAYHEIARQLVKRDFPILSRDEGELQAYAERLVTAPPPRAGRGRP